MRAITPRYLFGGSGIEVRGVLLQPGATVQLPGPPNDGRHLPHPYPTIWSHLRGIFNIQMTRWVARVYPGSEAGTCFHSNRSSRLRPADRGMYFGRAVPFVGIGYNSLKEVKDWDWRAGDVRRFRSQSRMEEWHGQSVPYGNHLLHTLKLSTAGRLDGGRDYDQVQGAGGLG